MPQDVEDVDMSLRAADVVVSSAVALTPPDHLPPRRHLRRHHPLHPFLGSLRDLCVREVCHTTIVSRDPRHQRGLLTYVYLCNVSPMSPDENSYNFLL